MIWMTALTVLTKGTAILKIAVLARILSPAQFGSYGVALLVLGLLEMLTETGINIFLIQQRSEIKTYLNSAWVTSILRGFLIAILIIFATPYVLSFFSSLQNNYLLNLVAALAVIRGFINPMVVAYQKNLEFVKVFIFKGGLYLLDAIVAVTLGILTGNESAMIIGMIVAGIIEVLLSFVLFKDRPRLVFEKEKFLKVLNAGKWITGAGIFSYLFQNIDNIVVGRVMGTGSLGLYQQSYSIATLPVTGVSDIFNRVLFPTFVKVSGSRDVLKKSFIKSFGLIFLLALGFGVLISLFSHQIILIFLGDRWLSIEPTLKILALFGALKAVLNSTYSLFLSQGMQKVVMLSELSGILGLFLSIFPLVTKFGTVGAAIATIIAVLVSLPVVLVNIGKVLGNEKK